MEFESAALALAGAGGAAIDTGADVVLLLTVTVSTAPVVRARTTIGPKGSPLPKTSSERGEALVRAEFLLVLFSMGRAGGGGGGLGLDAAMAIGGCGDGRKKSAVGPASLAAFERATSFNCSTWPSANSTLPLKRCSSMVHSSGLPTLLR